MWFVVGSNRGRPGVLPSVYAVIHPHDNTLLSHKPLVPYPSQAPNNFLRPPHTLLHTVPESHNINRPGNPHAALPIFRRPDRDPPGLLPGSCHNLHNKSFPASVIKSEIINRGGDDSDDSEGVMEGRPSSEVEDMGVGSGEEG